MNEHAALWVDDFVNVLSCNGDTTTLLYRKRVPIGTKVFVKMHKWWGYLGRVIGVLATPEKEYHLVVQFCWKVAGFETKQKAIQHFRIRTTV